MKRIFFFCLLVISTTIQSSELPLEYFTKHGDYLDMKLSPDGKHIAARIRAKGRVSFVVLNTETLKTVGGMRPNEGDIIHSVEWINSERLVYQFAEKTTRYDTPIATGELFAVDYDGKRNARLFGYRAIGTTTASRINEREDTNAAAEVISYLPDEDRWILIAEYPFNVEGNYFYNDKERPPRIVKLNVYNGKKRKVGSIPFKNASVFATDKGEVNFVRYTDENYVAKAAFRKNEKEEWQDLSELLGSDMLPQAISNDGSRIYLTGKEGESKLTTMFEFELATKTLKPLFTDLETSIERFVWDDKQQRPVVGISYPNKHQYHYAEGTSKTASLQKSFAASFKGQEVYIQSESRDGNFFLLHVSSEVNPGEYYLYNNKTKGASFLWANRSWLDPRTLAGTQHFTFNTTDDLKIHAYVTMPTNLEEGSKAPFVTMIHGGPHGFRDYADFDSEVQLLANRGYAVVQVNFRGSGGYGQDFMQAGYLEWGGAMINDILEGTKVAIEKFSLNATKGCVYGASYGGYAAMMASIRAPEMFRCVIGYVGVYDLNYMFSESDTAEAFGGKAYLERVVGKDKAVLDANSPVNHADKIKANVMIIHGEKDARVPVINAETMVKKLTDAGNKPQYLNFSKSGHGVYDEEGRKTLYQALLDFLDTNI